MDPTTLFSTFAALLVAARKLGETEDAASAAQQLSALAQNARTLRNAVRGLGLWDLVRRMEAVAKDADRAFAGEPDLENARHRFADALPHAIPAPGLMVDEGLMPDRVVAAMLALIRTAEDIARDFFATPLPERYFAAVAHPVLDGLLRDPDYNRRLDPLICRAVLAQLEGLHDDTQALLAGQKSLTENVAGLRADLAARDAHLAASIPLAELKAMVAVVEPGAQNRDEIMAVLASCIRSAATGDFMLASVDVVAGTSPFDPDRSITFDVTPTTKSGVEDGSGAKPRSRKIRDPDAQHVGQSDRLGNPDLAADRAVDARRDFLEGAARLVRAGQALGIAAVPEETLFAMARRINARARDRAAALADLDRAATVAAGFFDRTASPIASAADIDTILSEAADLARAGRLHEATAAVNAHLSDVSKDAGRLRSAAIDIALMRQDPSTAAEMIVAQAKAENPDPASVFAALEEAKSNARTRRQRLGSPPSLDAALSVELADRMLAWAPDRPARLEAQLAAIWSRLDLADLRADPELLQAARRLIDAIETPIDDVAPEITMQALNTEARLLAEEAACAGDPERMEAAILRARQLAELAVQGRERGPAIVALVSLGNYLTEFSELQTDPAFADQAMETLTAARRLALNGGTTDDRSRAEYALGSTLVRIGETRQDRDLVRHGLAHLRQAQRLRDPDTETQGWLNARDAIGCGFSTLGSLTGAPHHFRLATAIGRDALAYIDRTTAPGDWAKTTLNLAAHLLGLGQTTDSIDALTESVAHCDAAMEIWQRDIDPERWLLLTLNAAGALFARAELSGQSADYAAAAARCEAAGTRARNHTNPQTRQEFLRVEANAQWKVGTAERAPDRLRAAAAAFSALRRANTDPDERILSEMGVALTLLEAYAISDEIQDLQAARAAYAFARMLDRTEGHETHAAPLAELKADLDAHRPASG